MTSKLDRWLSNPTYDYTPEEIYVEVEGDAVASDVWDTLIETTLPALRQGKRAVLGGLYTVGSDSYTRYQRQAIFLAVEQGFREAEVLGFTAEAVLHAGSAMAFWKLTPKTSDRIHHAFGTTQDRVIEGYVQLLKKAHASWGKIGWITAGNVSFGMGMIPYGDSLPSFEKVGGDFTCANQRLQSLEGCPREVGGMFFASDNLLTSLEGGPEKVGADYYCDNNRLTTLKGAPREIPGEFLCYDNELKDLQGAPTTIGKGFSATKNALRSLKGGPKRVGGGYNVDGNVVLTSIEGVATYIDGDFTCDSANLKSLTPLLKSTVTMHVNTRFGYFESWPPPEGTVLTASSDDHPAPPLPDQPSSVAAMSTLVKRWLAKPSYDDMPSEVEDELEEGYAGEVWDTLIEHVLPALHKGNKSVLRGFESTSFFDSYTQLQTWAILYAVKDGFRETDILAFLAGHLLHQTLGVNTLDAVDMGGYAEVLAGRSSRLDGQDLVLATLRDKNTHWRPEGWVVNAPVVNLSGLKLQKLPRFAWVTGGFHVQENNLKTLEGSPANVGSTFEATANDLVSLEGCPKEVGGHFYCDNNPRLKSLKPLQHSRIGGSVYTDFGTFRGWPPSTSAFDNRYLFASAGGKLKQWLKNPSYDDVPEEIDEELEDNLLSDIWDILIERALPALRKGDRRTLDSYQNADIGNAWSLNQVVAFLYAVEAGFKEQDLLAFFAPMLLEERLGLGQLEEAGLRRYHEVLLGKSRQLLTTPYTVIDTLNYAKARWSPKGWVVPATFSVELSALQLEALPLFAETKGTFNCSNNKLKNLKGSPRKVGGEFNCQSNNLTTLDGCPLEVEGSFLAHNNPKLKSVKALLKSKVGGVLLFDFGSYSMWPPSPSDPLSRMASVSVEASRASEDRWFRDPTYEGAPLRIERILDSMSVQQELWYEIIDTYVPALRAGKKAILDFLLRTYEQYDADQMKALLYAAEQGFKRSGEHVALAVNYLLYNPLAVAARIAAPAFKVDIRQNSHLFNKLVGIFHAAEAHYTPDGWVVPGDLNLNALGLEKVPPIVSVGGDLLLSDNKLTSLEGCPRRVPGDFTCGNNVLRSLEGGPDWVGQDYYCYSNRLPNLRGAPSYVGNDFYAYLNPFTSHEGKPRHIGGLFEAV